MYDSGIYVRVERDGLWDNVPIEACTEEEVARFMQDRPASELVRWVVALAGALARFQRWHTDGWEYARKMDRERILVEERVHRLQMVLRSASGYLLAGAVEKARDVVS